MKFNPMSLQSGVSVLIMIYKKKRSSIFFSFSFFILSPGNYSWNSTTPLHTQLYRGEIEVDFSKRLQKIGGSDLAHKKRRVGKIEVVFKRGYPLFSY